MSYFRTLQLKNKTFPNVVMSPLAGITDRAFREMVRRWNKESLVFTEMINAVGLVQSKKLQPIAELWPADHPIGVQLGSADPVYIAKAAEKAEQLGAAVIDINMACPVPKIVKNGDGAAIACDLRKAEAVIRAAIRATSLPVTIKLRAGWDEHSINAPEVAQMAEQCGVSMVTIHGRTRAQMYQGLADWNVVAEAQRRVNIPVLGAGDIRTPQDAEQKIRDYGVAGVFLARGAIGKPWFPSQVLTYLRDGTAWPVMDAHERLDAAIEHVRLMVAHTGEKVGIPESRKHLQAYTQGLPGSAEFRQKVTTVPSLDEVIRIIEAYREQLAGHLAAKP